ncbi:swr complex subunit [Lecanora helva]
MMGSDARDVMGLPSAAPPKSTPAKAPKPKSRGPTGISREILDLKYEGAPPISIVAPKFKEKPKLPFKPRAWEEMPFRNSARKDGLILKHWRRKGDVGNVGAALPVTPADSNAASEMETDDKTTTAISDSHFAKFNVKVEKPQYTDEQYETHLKSEDWSREETDYLVDLSYEFDLRWIIVYDRYDYQPGEATKESGDSMTVTPSAPPRTQEDMKARYYDVAAKTMVLHNPLSSMSSSEFDTHEKMTKYDPQRETQRKKYVEQLMQRTDEEKHEEEMLLKELSRIVLNQEKLSSDRKALYDRLEPATNSSRDSFSTTMYQSSAGLTQLMQQLVTQSRNRDAEKKEKRRSAIEAGDLPNGLERNHRHSLAGSDKRASIGGDTSHRRQLSAREEAKWGVTRPNERLTGGVQFRHERVIKAGQAKSGVQTTRIAAALTELKIPPRLFMPTAKVVTEYEHLIEKIKVLLEARKVTEKLDGEIKVWKAQKEQQEARERGEEVKEEEQGSQKGEGDGEEEDEEEEDEEASRVDVTQNDESKVENEDEDENEDENEDEASGNEEEDNDEEKEKPHSEAEDAAENLDNSNNEDSEEDDDANQAPDLQNGGAEDQDQDQQEDEPAPDDEPNPDNDNDNESEEENEEDEPATSPAAAAPSPAPTTKSEGTAARKRSASVISHVSNRSSKRVRK